MEREHCSFHCPILEGNYHSINGNKEFSFDFFFVSDLTFLTPKGTIGQFL